MKPVRTYQVEYVDGYRTGFLNTSALKHWFEMNEENIKEVKYINVLQTMTPKQMANTIRQHTK